MKSATKRCPLDFCRGRSCKPTLLPVWVTVAALDARLLAVDRLVLRRRSGLVSGLLALSRLLDGSVTAAHLR